MAELTMPTGSQPNGNLKRNSIFSAAEMVVSGICLFFIYRNVVQVLGVSMLGVWSLVLATTGFGRAADLGIGAGLARFVGRSLGEGDPNKAILYMRTGVSFMAITMGAVAALLWYPMWWGLDIALDGRELSAARSVLPWAILCLWLLLIKTALDSCLTGVHRADLRATSGIIGMIFQVAASLALVQGFGLHGLAWAQTGQFALAIVMEVVFLLTIARVGGGEISSPRPWLSRPHLKEMLGFGVKLQIGSIANLMFEPVVKTVLAAAAGTHVLGIFEIAYRMTYQVRNVATMALQPTVPAFAQLSVHGGPELVGLFRRVSRNAALATAALMSAVALGGPLASWLYLGSVDPLFVYVTGLMSIMWAATILAGPAYYLGIASGRVAPYVTGEFLAVSVASVSVFMLGMAYAPAVAVIGVMAGKIVGSAVPAALIRPGADWKSSAIANTDNWRSILIVLLCSGPVIGVAISRM